MRGRFDCLSQESLCAAFTASCSLEDRALNHSQLQARTLRIAVSLLREVQRKPVWFPSAKLTARDFFPLHFIPGGRCTWTNGLAPEGVPRFQLHPGGRSDASSFPRWGLNPGIWGPSSRTWSIWPKQIQEESQLGNERDDDRANLLTRGSL